MKIALLFFTILITCAGRGQTISDEHEIAAKGEFYYNIYDGESAVGLSEAELKYLDDNPQISTDQYLVEKAYYYFSALVQNYPESADIGNYQFKKGLMATDLCWMNDDGSKKDEAKACFKKAVESGKSDNYKLLALHRLSTMYCDENDCEAAKKCIAQFRQLNADVLNSYQKEYTAAEFVRILKKCR